MSDMRWVTLFETGVDPGSVTVEESGAVEVLRPEGPPLAVVPVPSGELLADHLGWPTDDAEVMTLCSRHVQHVLRLVHSQTRGRGFSVGTDPQMAADLAEVVISAAARSVADPTQARRVEVGTVVTSPTPFARFTLAEQAVINRYRVRTA